MLFKDPILITGGAGFIGSHIADRLVKRDKNVRVYDNFSTGDLKNLRNCKDEKNFHLIKDDLKNTKKIKASLKDVKTVFHFAAYPEVRTGYDHPEIAYKQNIQNTFELLENIRKSSVENIVFTSSSVVYGEPKIIPTPENYGPLIPISVYGGSKLACEALLSSYCYTYGIKGTIIRLANVIGSRGSHGVIWDFIHKLKNNNKILRILGDGKQIKSYIHVSDCIDAIFFAMSKSKSELEIFNIGNDDKVNVMSIAKTVCKAMYLSDVKLLTTGIKLGGRGWVGDVKQMQLDISKIKKLGWLPHMSSQQAVEHATKEILRDLI